MLCRSEGTSYRRRSRSGLNSDQCELRPAEFLLHVLLSGDLLAQVLLEGLQTGARVDTVDSVL